MRKIEVQKSETFKDVQIVTSNHSAERNLLHLSWDELEMIVKQGQALLDSRKIDRTCGLTDYELAEIASGADIDYHEDMD